MLFCLCFELVVFFALYFLLELVYDYRYFLSSPRCYLQLQLSLKNKGYMQNLVFVNFPMFTKNMFQFVAVLDGNIQQYSTICCMSVVFNGCCCRLNLAEVKEEAKAWIVEQKNYEFFCACAFCFFLRLVSICTLLIVGY